MSCLIPWTSVAQDAPAPDETPVQPADPDAEEGDGDPLSRYRTRFDTLAERAIGTATKPVAFNWRRTNAHVAVDLAFPFELNNFNSLRAGGLVRIPTQGLMLELGASYVRVWDTPSSRLLALTPYRQPGRPSRMEVEVGVAYPLAEGVVTLRPRYFPAAQLVFNAHASFRYLLYPNGFPNLTVRETLGAVFAPKLGEQEIENLDGARLDAMQVDPGRYGLMVGIGNDLYTEQGVFVSPRVMMALPLLAPLTGTELRVWAEVTVAVGMAF